MDLEALTRMHGEMLNLPRLTDIVKFGDLPAVAKGGPQLGPSPPNGQPQGQQAGPTAVPDASQWMNQEG